MIRIHEIKSISALVLPLMAAFLAQKSMQFIDTFMMGWIGSDALAAGALGTSIFMTILIFCMGLLSTVGVFIVRGKGARNNQEIHSSLEHGICLALLLAVPGMLLIWFSPHILIFFVDDTAVIEKVSMLLHGLVFGFPGFLLFLVFREFISAFSLTLVVMFVTFLSVPLNFIANYTLIYGKLGLPALGITGIGYGSSITMWFMFFGLWLYSKNTRRLKEFCSFSRSHITLRKLKEMLYIGIPGGLLAVLESSLFLFAALTMGSFGVEALAAHQIAMQCSSITYAIPFALSMATALQVGHAMGEQNVLKAQRAAIHGLAIGFVFTIITAAILIIASTPIANIFLNENDPDFKAVSQLASSFLIIAAFFQCFDGAQAIANGALRGLKDTFVPMLLSLGCYWFLGIGSAYYLAFHTDFGAKGIWYGFIIGLTSIGFILMLRLFFKMRSLQK